MNWERINVETVEGFEIEFAICPETDDPKGHFASGDDAADQETLDKIENGTYLWFQARVTASKAGIVLGTDHLGGCCYSSAKDFMAPDGYYPDMVREAISNARKAIEEINSY